MWIASTEVAATTSSPFRQLTVQDALEYLDLIKEKYNSRPHLYNRFLDIMKEFKALRLDTPGVIDRVLQLFNGDRELILGFNTFLPQGYRIMMEGDSPRVLYPPQPLPYPPQPAAAAPATPAPAAVPAALPLVPPMPVPPRPTQQKAPIEFDQAINYVTKIKTRFSRQPEVYKAFLEILHSYHKEQWTIKRIYEQVSTLFKAHPDLLCEFSLFLPDGALTLHMRMKRFRMVAKVIGRLVLLQRRAAERAYAPGGRGFEMCRDHFNAEVNRKMEPIRPVRCLTA